MSLRPVLVAAYLIASTFTASAQLPAVQDPVNPLESASIRQPHEYAVLLQGGNGLTDNRDGFHFLSAGVHAGRVLTNNMGHGILRGNFEYAAELYPFWQSYTPVFQRIRVTQLANGELVGSAPFNVGGTFTGVTVTPIILRWNFARHGRITPWAQAAGGLLWTNHKYPSYGDKTLNYNTNGPNGESSVFNFTPQGGIGLHYFTSQNRSIDFSANGVHISSASLGDRNPGVNASIQFTLGYTFWK